VIQKKTILAIIPARGGSKSVPNKNIKNLAGKPLICHTIDLANKINVFSNIVVSTDSDKIAKISIDSGSEVVFRPAELSDDFSRTEDALINVLDYYSSIGKKFDSVVTLEPTSPLRTMDTVLKCINRYMQSSCDSLVTIIKDEGYLWKSDDSNNFYSLFKNQPRRRQDRSPLYKETGVIYITDVRVLMEKRSIIGDNACHYVVGERESLDINSYMDFHIADSIMKNKILIK